jgi:hypothetical protein
MSQQNRNLSPQNILPETQRNEPRRRRRGRGERGRRRKKNTTKPAALSVASPPKGMLKTGVEKEEAAM